MAVAKKAVKKTTTKKPAARKTVAAKKPAAKKTGTARLWRCASCEWHRPPQAGDEKKVAGKARGARFSRPPAPFPSFGPANRPGP